VLVESQIGWFVSDLDNDEEGRKREEDEQEEMKVLKHGKECSWLLCPEAFPSSIELNCIAPYRRHQIEGYCAAMYCTVRVDRITYCQGS
jgi:hypothetical protein